MSNSNPQLKQYIREHLTNMYLELQESNKARRAEIRAKKAALGNVGGEGDLNATKSGGRSSTASADDRIAKGNFRRAQKSTPGPTVSSPAMIKAQTKNNDMSSSASAITSARGKDMLGRVAAKMGDQNAATMADNTALAGQNAALTAAAQATPMGKWKMGIANTDSKLFGNAAVEGGAASTKGLMGSGGKVGMGTKLAGAGAAAAIQGMSSAETEWKENKNKGMSDADNMGKTALRGTVAAAGAGLGTYGGMAAGAKLGSAIGPVGTLIGAAVGGLAGGYFGGNIADRGADMVTNIGDNDSEIAKFRADREIEGIQNAGRIQKAKQDVADAGRTKGSGVVPVGGTSTSSDDGEDFEDNRTSADGRQQQRFRFSSRGNGNGVGGNVYVDSSQSQRQ